MNGVLALTLRVRPFLAPSSQRNVLRVLIDGKRRASHEFIGVAPETCDLKVLVPAMLGRTSVELSFVVDKLVSPLSAGVNDDPRPLGIALVEIQVGLPAAGPW